MIGWLSEKISLYTRFLMADLPRLYRQNYTLLYPHGILKKAGKCYPEIADIEVFIETGTFQGKTAKVESSFFREVHTIELNEKLYEKNLPLFNERFPNIRSYLGDSALVLPAILREMKEPCLIFLDAHWSGDQRVDWDKSKWRGYQVDTSFRGNTWPPTSDQQCPLADEVKVINENFRNAGLIVIDDWAMAGTKDSAFIGEDWSEVNLERILDNLGRERVVDYFETSYEGKARLNIVISATLDA